MLKWGKMESAARRVPRNLLGKSQVLAYLHKQANSTRAHPFAWKEHEHKNDGEIFDCVVAGLGMRPHRLSWLIEQVTSSSPKEQPVLLGKLLRAMVSNSRRSFRQKENAAA